MSHIRDGIREDGTVEDRLVETYYRQYSHGARDDDGEFICIIADDGGTNIETRLTYDTLKALGFVPEADLKAERDRIKRLLTVGEEREVDFDEHRAHCLSVERDLLSEIGKSATVNRVLDMVKKRIDADCPKMACLELREITGHLLRLIQRVRGYEARALDDIVR